MKRVATSRRHLADLLRRRPLLDATMPPSEDPTQQQWMDEIREMLELPATRSGTEEPHRLPVAPVRQPPGSSRI